MICNELENELVKKYISNNLFKKNQKLLHKTNLMKIKLNNKLFNHQVLKYLKNTIITDDIPKK